MHITQCREDQGAALQRAYKYIRTQSTYDKHSDSTCMNAHCGCTSAHMQKMKHSNYLKAPSEALSFWSGFFSHLVCSKTQLAEGIQWQHTPRWRFGAQWGWGFLDRPGSSALCKQTTGSLKKKGKRGSMRWEWAWWMASFNWISLECISSICCISWIRQRNNRFGKSWEYSW